MPKPERQRRPQDLTYRKAGYFKLPDGSEVIGLKRRPDGRFYAAQQPTKTFGKDPAEAVFRFRQWLAKKDREYVAVSETVPVDTTDACETGKWLLSEWNLDLRIDPQTNTVSRRIDAAAFYARARAEILKDPRLFAKRVGIPEIGYLEKLEAPPPSISLVEAGEIYHREKEGDIAAKQWKNSKVWWQEFLDLVPVKNVDELNRDAFQAYAAEIKKRQTQKSPKTGKPRGKSWVRSRFITVQTVINYLRDAKKISAELHARLQGDWKQPLKKVAQPKGAKYVIKPAEFQAMLEIADDFMRALLLLGVNAAFYPSDFDLRWEHVDLDDKTLCCRRQKCNVGDSEGVLRMAVLWNDTVDALKKLRRKDVPHVFATRTGNPIAASTVWDRFIRLRKKAGVDRPLRPEDLRNTAATIAAEKASKAQYDVLMGHSLGREDEGYIEKHRFFTKDACEAIREYLLGTVTTGPVSESNGQNRQEG